MKYRYALNSKKEIIDVLTIEDKTRRVGAPFKCVGCGGELTPNIPKKKVKYFSHKPDQACSKETYLHKLGILRFYSQYKYCLDNSKPFIFENKINVTCTHNQKEYGFTCDVDSSSSYDLTNYFDIVTMEKGRKGFVADVLLSSSKNDQVTFIEFVVSHECEQDKIESGIRIFEFFIGDEESLEWIESSKIKHNQFAMRLHNVKERVEVKDHCSGQCDKGMFLFMLYESQKAIVLNVKMRNINKNPPTENLLYRGIYISEVDAYGYDISSCSDFYVQGIRDALFKAKKKFKNCYNCKYHGINTNLLETGVFCKYQKRVFDSTEAITCEVYRPFPSYEAAELADKQNAEYSGIGISLSKDWFKF